MSSLSASSPHPNPLPMERENNYVIAKYFFIFAAKPDYFSEP